MLSNLSAGSLGPQECEDKKDVRMIETKVRQGKKAKLLFFDGMLGQVKVGEDRQV